MQRRNGERVGSTPNCGPEPADSAIPQIVRTEIGRIVRLVVPCAFDVTSTAKRGINGHRKASRRAAAVREGPRLIVLGSCESASGAGLARAGARDAVPTQAIPLSQITRRERIRSEALVRPASTGRYGKRNRLIPTRIS